MLLGSCPQSPTEDGPALPQALRFAAIEQASRRGACPRYVAAFDAPCSQNRTDFAMIRWRVPSPSAVVGTVHHGKSVKMLNFGGLPTSSPAA